MDINEFIKDKYTVDDLLRIMRFLRSPEGCPWDREQTHMSIRGNVVEEAYEVVDAIESSSSERVSDELGDLLLQIVFHSQMAKEAGEYDFEDVVGNICRKLVSRHTHIFGEDSEKGKSSEAVLDLWDSNKKKEKKHTSQTQAMLDVPRSFPSLLRAYKIQRKAAKAGFDWKETDDVAAKVEEEFREIREAVNRDEVIDEFGDLLFSVVNYARFLEIDPELALDRANNKFIRRFGKVESLADENGLNMKDMSIDELDKLWEKVKADET